MTTILGTHLLFEIMKMLQLGNAKNVDIAYQHKWIDMSLYDNVIANQSAPRVLTTHQSVLSLPLNFRCAFIFFEDYFVQDI